MMNIHESKQLTLTCSYDCLPPMERIVWFKINDKGNFILRENKHTLVLNAINRNQTGIYVCQVLNVVGEGQANISVTVQCKYSPNSMLTNDHGYVVNIFRSFPHSRLIAGFVTRLTRRVSLVEQGLLTHPEHLSSSPVFNGVRVPRSSVLCVCFVDRCLSVSFGHCVVCSSSIYGF